MFTNKLRLFLFAIVTTVFCACSQNSLDPIPQNGVILAFGDSLTAGIGTDKANAYPSVLAQLSGREVINAGVSGEVTAQGVDRLKHLLKKTQVDLIILLEGGNDILRNLPATETKNNLAKMIEEAKSYNIDVVLIGVPEKKLFSSVAPFYPELAEEHELVFEDNLIGELLRSPEYKSDSIHFNTKGYRVMAESIYELLQDHDAL